MFQQILCIFFVILLFELGSSSTYNQREPVIEIEFDEDNVGEEDGKLEAIKYVEENYKAIHKKMKGHEKGVAFLYGF